MKIADFIDLFGKHLSRIKNISIGLLIVMLSLSSVMNGCNRKKSEELFEKVTGLNLENVMLKKQVDEAGAEIIEKQRIQDSLQLAYNLKVGELNSLKRDYRKLKGEFNDLKGSILMMPAEESYEFLNKVAYPYPGIKRFPFNEPQVKGIHLTWLENSNLKLQNTNLTDQINRAELMVADLGNMNKQSEEKFNLAMSNSGKYEKMFENSEEARVYTEDELKRIRRQNKLLRWGVVGGTGAGFLFGLLLLK